MKDCLEQIINENCLLTLGQINRELRRRLPVKPEIHYRTVARTLDGMLFRVKLVRPFPAERNRPNVLLKRVNYANWFVNQAIVRHCVFVGECGYNIWTARSHGRARLGERGVPPSVRPARTKLDCDHGKIAYQWTCDFPQVPPYIPPRVAQSLHYKTRVPPRSCAIYIGVQNYKSSKLIRTSTNPRTGRSALYSGRHYQLKERHQGYNHEC